MKKIYITPEILVVKLASKQTFLQSSYTINNMKSNEDAWTREYKSPNYDKNIWDDEW